MSTIYSGYGRYEDFGGGGADREFSTEYDYDYEYDDFGPPLYGRGRTPNVGRIERWASVLGGLGLVALAARQRRATGLAAGAVGTYLIARGVSGRCLVYEAAHLSTCTKDTKEALGGPRGVHVYKVMTINRPIDAVYRYWRDLSNLPAAMRHLESVTLLGAGRSHWVAKGPAGMRVEWDAEIINEEENRVIGWRSLEHADVVSAGSVNFRDAPDGATEITVKLQYEPPAGRVGALIAKLFGEEPSQQIEEDLRRLKTILEAEGERDEADERGERRERRERERLEPPRLDATPFPGASLKASLGELAQSHVKERDEEHYTS
jgi:uncharacterized membrane protein